MALLEPAALTTITEDRKFTMKKVFAVFLGKYGGGTDNVIILFLTCVVLSILQNFERKIVTSTLIFLNSF